MMAFEAGVVDILALFRRRRARPQPPRLKPGGGSMELDSMGGRINHTFTDAFVLERKPSPPRAEPRERLEARKNEVRKEQPKPRQDGGTRHEGYLAVHAVEKSFVGRKVVKGVSLYVRRGEAVGLLG